MCGVGDVNDLLMGYYRLFAVRVSEEAGAIVKNCQVSKLRWQIRTGTQAQIPKDTC